MTHVPDICRRVLWSRWGVVAYCLAACFLVGAEGAQAQDEAQKWMDIPEEIWTEMISDGNSWHPNMGCLEQHDLALVKVPYLDFKGRSQTGELIVARSVADEVFDAFTEIFRSKAFRIERMERIDKYAGDDDASMAANNTSAFNCRYVGGTTTLSAHALGIAIDINPVQNPLVAGTKVYPPEGKDYVIDRSAETTGIILAGDVVTIAFSKVKTSPTGNSWVWGGDWTGTRKDYQHFSENGK